MRIFNRIILVVVGIVVALLLTEGLFRLSRLAPQVAVLTNATEDAPYIRSSNPALVYELKPNYRNPNPTNHHGSFSYVNAFGQRDIERQLERIPGKKRVILLGDSVVAGHGQPDLNETISRKLEQDFEGKVEVLNFGVGGYNTAAEVELLRVKGLQFSPDVVVLMTVFNDGDGTPGEPPSTFDVPRPAWQKQLFLHSDLFRYSALKLNLFRFRERVTGQWSQKKIDPVDGEHKQNNSYPQHQNNMASGFAKLKNLSGEFSFKVGVVVWPTFEPNEICNCFYERTKDGNLYFDQLIAEHQFPSMHLLEPFKKDLAERCPPGAPAPCPSPGRVYTAADGIHPNSLGASVAAKHIRPLIEKLLQD